MQYTELTPRTLDRMKKLMSLVVNASVAEAITSLNGYGSLPYTFSPLWVGDVEWCAGNEKVTQDAAATAMCVFIKSFTFCFYSHSEIRI